MLTVFSAKPVHASPAKRKVVNSRKKVVSSRKKVTSPAGRYLSACIATQYAHKGDKWAGERFACTRGKVNHRKFGIAHRTLPCGTMVLITNIRTGRSVRAPVIDRGPYWVVPRKCSRDDRGFPSHACWRRGRALVRSVIKPTSRITFASCADLTPPVARAIGLNGKEPVIVYALPKPKPKKRHHKYHRPHRTRRNW